ncbi:MAG: Uma2 family endonuclease [Candidatus Competibacteraceae bacterium]|nr:Uma2 family endonuclease [Candidatus Competibacteraceae bacterium]
MAERAHSLPVSVEDYLRGELGSEVRHEYIDGRIRAMVGASSAHNLIAGNLFAALHAHLRGSPCRVFMADMKLHVRTQTGERFYYPDLQVCCDPTDGATYYRQRPMVVAEVLSPHTEREDRSSKFYAYRHLDSLQAYLLVAQDLPRVEVYRRASNWDLELYGEGQRFNLESLDFTLSLEQLYEGVEPQGGL